MKNNNEQPTTKGIRHLPQLLPPAELLLHISDAVIATDMNLNVISFNPAAEEIYGIPSSQIVGHKLYDFIRYRFHGTTEEEASLQLRLNGPWKGKVSFERNDGKTVELLATVSYIKDSNGNRTGIVAVNKDITELEAVQKKSAGYKRRLKSVLNGTTEALFLVDAHCKLLLINRNGRAFIKKFLGKEPEPGCNFLEVFPAHHHDQIKASITKALNGEHSEYEVFYPGDLWCLVNYTPVLNEYTDEKEVCISARDITQRKTAEEEIKMLSLLARDTANGVMITDANNLITWVNESFTRVYGFSKEELIGHHPEKLFAGADIDAKTLRQIHEHIRTGKHFNCELTSYHKNGSKLWLRLDMQPIFDEQEKLVKYFVILTNLTEERKQKEKEFQNKIKEQKKINRIVLKTQEDISNELGRELHDNINQILTAAKLQLEFAETGTDSHEAFIKKGRSSVEEALKEIRRLSKQLTAPRFAETNLLNEIVSVLENLRLEEITKLDCSNFKEEQLCPDVKLHIFRILQEQLKNIVKYAKADEVHITLKNCERNLCLTITDNGVGFDPRQKKNGIGLTNIRNRVESYNGKLEVHAAPGSGCNLIIKIPLQKD